MALREFAGGIGQPHVAVERNVELPLARLGDGIHIACNVPSLESFVRVTGKDLYPGAGFPAEGLHQFKWNLSAELPV